MKMFCCMQMVAEGNSTGRKAMCHAQMLITRRGETNSSTLQTVGIHGVLHCHIAVVVHVAQRHAVLLQRLLHDIVGSEAAALAVRHPHAQRGALHALQHDRVRLLHAHVHEATCSG